MKKNWIILLVSYSLVTSLFVFCSYDNQQYADLESTIENTVLVKSTGYSPIVKGRLYTIITSAGNTWTIQVEDINGTWVKGTSGRSFNIDNISSIEPI